MIETVKNLRSQENIISKWNGPIDQPVVSVLCIAFNHEKYIARAIEGVLLQETDFAFELIIHDDASKDGTQNVIKYYSERYSAIIKVIYQDKNQYSINPHRPLVNAISRSKGKFLAICEGDDYWCDARKLSKQVAVFLENERVSMVFSSAIQVKDSSTHIRNDYNLSGIFNVDLDWVCRKKGGFYPTASVMFKRKSVSKLPAWFFVHPTGDFPLALICKLSGDFYYINEPLVVYQVSSKSVSHKKLSGADLLYDVLGRYKREIRFINLLSREGLLNSKNIKRDMRAIAEYEVLRKLAYGQFCPLRLSANNLRFTWRFKLLIIYAFSKLRLNLEKD